MPTLRWISSGRHHQSDSVKRISTNPQTVHLPWEHCLCRRRMALPSSATSLFFSSVCRWPSLKAYFPHHVSVHSICPHSIQQLQVRNPQTVIYSTYRVITADSSSTNITDWSENRTVYSWHETTLSLCFFINNKKGPVCVHFTSDHKSNTEYCGLETTAHC